MLFCLIAICQTTLTEEEVYKQRELIFGKEGFAKCKNKVSKNKKMQQCAIDYAHLMPQCVYEGYIGKIVCLDIKFIGLVVNLCEVKAKMESHSTCDTICQQELQVLNGVNEALKESVTIILEQIESLGCELSVLHHEQMNGKDAKYYKKRIKCQESMKTIMECYRSFLKFNFDTRWEIELFKDFLFWIKARLETVNWEIEKDCKLPAHILLTKLIILLTKSLKLLLKKYRVKKTILLKVNEIKDIKIT